MKSKLLTKSTRAPATQAAAVGGTNVPSVSNTLINLDWH